MTGLPSQFQLLGNALNGSKQNHHVISQNIANVNTPGYQTREIAFEEFMKQVSDGAAFKGNLEEIPVRLVAGLENRNDGNNVDMDQQVAELKKNALAYQTYSHLLASKMATLRRAISG